MVELPAPAYVVFGPLYAAMLALHARSSWRKFKGFAGEKRFQFHLLDLVAAVLGFSPSVWLAAQALQGSGFGPLQEGAARLSPSAAWLIAGSAGISQLVGMFVGHIHGAIPPQDPPQEWVDAVWVFGGALYGLVLLAVSFVAFVIGYVVVSFLFFSGPVYVLLLVAFVALVLYAIHLHS